MQLTEVAYTLRLCASDSRQYELVEELLSHWLTYMVGDSFKVRLAGFELQKPAAAKALQMCRLSAFAFETIMLWNFDN